MGSKGSSVKIDTRPLANAAQYAADVGERLGTEQLNEARRQYDNDMRVATPIIEAQTGLMRQSIEQGDDYYDYMKGTFRPIEQDLAEEAATGRSRYDTNVDVRANVERESSRAAADVQTALANSQAQNARAMASMGVNPNSGRFAAMKVGEGLQAAAMRAGAATNARDKAVNLDYAKRMDVTGLGRGLPGASQGAYSMALNSGNSAVSNQLQTGQKLLGGMQAGNGTIMQGQGMKLQGLQGALSAQTSAAGMNAQMAAQESASTASGLGAIAGAAMIMTCDRRLKRDIVRIGEFAPGVGIYLFKYIWSDELVMGFMADEMEAFIPEAVVEWRNGFKAIDLGVVYDKASEAICAA